MPIAGQYQRKVALTSWVPAFLKAMAQGLCVREACRIASTCPSTVYHHRQNDEAFRACWDRAVERGTELLEQEAVRRAYHGIEKPVFYKGEQCGTIQEYSDTLLMFVLRGRKPETYRDKGNETTVNVQTNVQANAVAARTIREMIADGSLQPILEGIGQGERAPAVTGTPGDGGHGREVGASTAFAPDQLNAGNGVAHPE